MKENESFIQSLEFLNSLIDYFDDLGWSCKNADTLKRLEKSRECLRKAYIYAETILHI